MNPEPLILGHNQFFGVNHGSAARGLERELYFGKVENVMEIVRAAHGEGVRCMMLSTHIRARDIARAISEDPVLSEEMSIYVLLPYMAKYVRMANQKGLLSMVSEILGSGGWSSKLNFALEAGVGIVRRDQLSMLESLIEMELAPFRGLKVRAVFLHNALSDLIAALELTDIARFFVQSIASKLGAEGGFCTLSMRLVSRFLHRSGIENPLIMAPFNPAGFQMSPGRKECEEDLVNYPARVVAMSVLAAGMVKPSDAAQYLKSIGIKSAVVGASSTRHVRESFKEIGAALK
ncbi:MAG: hypothetical protein JNM27_22460 [Leptospirales bacterium]|nr:hypothetical protein [Leptospirales bacterium]